MNLNLQGKRALVTGGAKGIGQSIVAALAGEGVIVEYTSRTKGQSLDGFDPGEVDILVNNAGSNFDITDPYCSTEDLRKVMRLNFEIPVELSNKVIPYMKKQKWGRIVNITSCSGLENRGPWTYCASKAALTAYTKSMGRILAIEEPGIVMSAVYPGVVYTGGYWELVLKERPEHWERYKKEIPVGRFGDPCEIVPYVVLQCSDLASFAHGSIIGVDGGLSKGFGQHL